MSQEQVITKTAAIQFHTGEYTSDHQFGTITFEINSLPMNAGLQCIHFKNDMSGSMGDRCSDGRSKMSHLIHTKNNMLSVLAKNADTTDILVESFGFDDEIENIFPETKITFETLPSIQAKIAIMLQPRNQTDIGLALSHYDDSKHPDATKTVVFMTDGVITSGVTDTSILCQMLKPETNYYFVGYGKDHDSSLLQTLATKANSKYYFVDAIENAGIVFGEILHSILYSVLSNAFITVENGEIYDYVRNVWTDRLTLGGVVSEEAKTFHIRKSKGCDVTVTLQSSDGTCITFTQNPDADLTKYILRQETQEMLYLVANTSPYQKAQVAFVNEQLLALIVKITTYMKENNLEADEFYQILLTDLDIAKNTLGTSLAKMYCTSRNDSQGRSDAYGVTFSPGGGGGGDGCSGPPTLRRDGSTPNKVKIIQDVSQACPPAPLKSVFAGPTKMMRTSSM
jgi:hypothetical protein